MLIFILLSVMCKCEFVPFLEHMFVPRIDGTGSLLAHSEWYDGPLRSRSNGVLCEFCDTDVQAALNYNRSEAWPGNPFLVISSGHKMGHRLMDGIIGRTLTAWPSNFRRRKPLSQLSPASCSHLMNFCTQSVRNPSCLPMQNCGTVQFFDETSGELKFEADERLTNHCLNHIRRSWPQLQNRTTTRTREFLNCCQRCVPALHPDEDQATYIHFSWHDLALLSSAFRTSAPNFVPWYDSPLANNYSTYLLGISMIRDPRDVVISAYHFHRTCPEHWTSKPNYPFVVLYNWLKKLPEECTVCRSAADKIASQPSASLCMVLKDLSEEEGLFVAIVQTIAHFVPVLRNLVTNGEPFSHPRHRFLRYEDVWRQPRSTFTQVGRWVWPTMPKRADIFADRLTADLEQVRASHEKQLRAAQSDVLDGRHFRSGEPGQWKTVLNDRFHKVAFTMFGLQYVIDAFDYEEW